MAMWPLFLGFEDVVVVLCLVLFLLVRERPYLMVAGFIVVLLLLTNILMLLGYRSWLILAIPYIALIAVSFLGRAFLPRPVAFAEGHVERSRTQRMLLTILLIISGVMVILPILFLLILSSQK
jgi:hypothetical protein